MDRIRRFVEKEIRGLHETAYLLATFALFSALLAFLRDRLLASTFGAGNTLDIYYAAFRIPDIVFISIASLMSLFVLIPVLTQLQSKEEKQALIGNLLMGFSIMMLLVTALLWFLMPVLATLFFPKLLASGPTLIVLSRILLLQPIFLGISGILASVTQIHGRYMLYAIAPLLYNFSIIIGIVLLYPLFGLQGITYGVVLGAILHMGIQIPFAIRYGYLRPNSFKMHPSQWIKIIAVSLPRTLSMASNNIAFFVLVIIAATLGAGAVSVFSFAFNLQAAPLSIVGASYSVAAFPILSRFFARGEKELFCNHIIQATRHILFWSLPFMTLFIVLRAHIVRVVLGGGAFSWADTRLTAAALALFIISLTAQALSLLFIRGYYAAGETRKPLLINIATSVGIVAGAYVLVTLFNTFSGWRYFIEALFRVDSIPGVVILMLPLSYSIFSILNVLIFAVLFERDFGVLWAHISRTLFESFSAAIAAGAAAWITLIALTYVLSIDTFLGVFTTGFIAGIVGLLSAVGVFYLLGNKEIKEVYSAIHTRFWRFTPVLFVKKRIQKIEK